MRVLNGILAVFLILFTVAQLNDPDGMFWAAIYGAAAVWCALAALKPSAGQKAPVLAGLGASLVAALGGMVWFWPDTPHWWMQDVWWETETAREGMGMMIVVVSLLVAGLSLVRARS